MYHINWNKICQQSGSGKHTTWYNRDRFSLTSRAWVVQKPKILLLLYYRNNSVAWANFSQFAYIIVSNSMVIKYYLELEMPVVCTTLIVSWGPAPFNMGARATDHKCSRSQGWPLKKGFLLLRANIFLLFSIMFATIQILLNNSHIHGNRFSNEYKSMVELIS